MITQAVNIKLFIESVSTLHNYVTNNMHIFPSNNNNNSVFQYHN